MDPLKLGTRASALALAQTKAVIDALAAAGLAAEAVTFSTRGDRDLSKPLHELGDKGLFTAELEAALHKGTIDAAVHSAKDMSAIDDPALPIVAALNREEKDDVLIGGPYTICRQGPVSAHPACAVRPRSDQSAKMWKSSPCGAMSGHVWGFLNAEMSMP